MCNSRQLDLSDRIAIEAGLCAGKSFKEIARRIRCSPSTVSREVMRNREFIHGSFFLNNNCRYASRCKKKHICTNTYCDTLCVRCRSYDCRTGCSSYVPYRGGKLDYPPYVCNHCTYRHDCFKNRYQYSAKLAQAMSDARRSDCRKGTRIEPKELELLDAIVTAGIKKGQPLTHIYENHKHELSVSVRTIYNYVDEGILSVRNIDLRRKVRYKKRSKPIDTQEKDVPFYRFKKCSNWTSFFDCLQIYGKEKRPIVFFDDVGERNDKNDFYAALKDFYEENTSCSVPIILIGRPWEQIEFPHKTVSIDPFSTQEIAETLSVSDKESVDIFCLSAGITALLSLYNTAFLLRKT